MSDLQLIVGARDYGGWKSISVTRSIEQITGSYEFSVSEVAPDASAAADLLPGQRASVEIDKQTVISGYIDSIDISHDARQHSITISGRDAAADLADCAAIHEAGQWTDQGMLSIARDLAKPFGVPVAANTDLGAPFPRWNIEPGETVFENLDRMARQRGVLITSDGKGGIVLTTAGTQRVGTALVLGANILSGGVSISHAERFSEYIVIGQRARDDDNDPEEISGKRASAKDTLIKRYRPSIEVIEDVGDTATYQKRANWRRNVAAGRGIRATISVNGWTHATGLWQPNTLVVVEDKWLRLRQRELLISAVTYSLDESGSRTELTLVPREALTPESLPKNVEDLE